MAKFKVQDTSLCFISCHLAAHEGEKKATKRNNDIREILAGARVGPHKWMDAATQFDHCWFIGDLNYRVGGFPRAEVLQMTSDGRLEELLAQECE